jgi:hypothetical protein
VDAEVDLNQFIGNSDGECPMFQKNGPSEIQAHNF